MIHKDSPTHNKGYNKFGDEKGGISPGDDTSVGSAIQVNSKEHNRTKRFDIQGESQLRALGATDDQDLEEAENDLLFSSPKMRMEEVISNRRNQDQQKSAAEINSETEKNTTKAKAIRGASKFWLTPIEYLTSPFTPMEVQPESQIEKRNLDGSVVKDFQQFINMDVYSTPELDISERKDKKLDQISEELIQVFDFDNLDSSTLSQKEELIQKIIKLGGENYTADDLRKDILIIEMEDRLRKQDTQIGSKIKTCQGKDRLSKEKPSGSEQNNPERDDLGDKICKELEAEEFENIDDWTTPTVHDLDVYQQELGLYMNQEGLTSPNFGKPKRKRVRKSLKEIQEIEGLARDQRKIDELLNTGKGKSLPKAL